MTYNIEKKDPMDLFRYGLRAPDTRRQYPRRCQYILDFLKMPGILEDQAKQFISNARIDPQWAQQSLMSFIEFQKERVARGEIAESTITNYYKATKLFCVMNDLLLNWKKISRGLPIGRRAANDRAPSIEEIRKLIEYPDRRLKAIVFTMISSGIGIGAWDYLRWKDINLADELITLTAYKDKGRNIKPTRWPVQMTSRLKKELLQLQLQRKNKNDDALVFEQAKVNLRKLWTAAYTEAGVPKGTRLFYSVRHNFGTEMANEGMPLPALANLLGHSDVKMTMRYYNMNKKTIDKARDILNRRALVHS